MSFQGAVFTFAGAVEHHAGMKISGEKRPPLTLQELQEIAKKFESLSTDSTDKPNILYKEIGKEFGIQDAGILILKNGVSYIQKEVEHFDFDILWKKIQSLGEEGVDTKAYMRGRVVNKRARYNFNIMDEEEKADYAKGIGTTYPFTMFPNAQLLREYIGSLLPEDRIKGLYAEANIYHSDNSGIGFHGDTERGIVIGVNFGKKRQIEWQVFHKNLPIGERYIFPLEHGDIYCMTGMSAGINWKRSSIPTIRHRAGYTKWLDNDEKKNIKKWNSRKNPEKNGILEKKYNKN